MEFPFDPPSTLEGLVEELNQDGWLLHLHVEGEVIEVIDDDIPVFQGTSEEVRAFLVGCLHFRT